MRKRIIIDIDLDSSTGHPEQIRNKLEEIVENLRMRVQYEKHDKFNTVVYNDWEDPHTCDLDIHFNVVKGED